MRAMGGQLLLLRETALRLMRYPQSQDHHHRLHQEPQEMQEIRATGERLLLLRETASLQSS